MVLGLLPRLSAQEHGWRRLPAQTLCSPPWSQGGAPREQPAPPHCLDGSILRWSLGPALSQSSADLGGLGLAVASPAPSSSLVLTHTPSSCSKPQDQLPGSPPGQGGPCPPARLTRTHLKGSNLEKTSSCFVTKSAGALRTLRKRGEICKGPFPSTVNDALVLRNVPPKK